MTSADYGAARDIVFPRDAEGTGGMDQMTQAEAIDRLESGHRALGALFARLTDEQAAQPETIGGGDWSAMDLIGHIAFWNELAIDVIESWRANRTPEAEDIFGSDGVDKANAQNVERAKAHTSDEVRDRAARAHTALVSLIRQISDQEWRSTPPYETKKPRQMCELLGAVTGDAVHGGFAHAFAHEPDLRAAVEAFGA